MLRTDDGRTAWVSDLQFRSGTVDVFNFEVAGLHNYFVEELAGVGVLVHNAPGCFDGAVAAAQDALASKGAGAKASAGLKPTQGNVSGPKVDRLAADMKENGFDPTAPIKLDGDHVVDGHHRVMAADKAGVDIVTTPGGSVSADVKANAPADFSEVNVLDVDY